MDTGYHGRDTPQDLHESTGHNLHLVEADVVNSDSDGGRSPPDALASSFVMVGASGDSDPEVDEGPEDGAQVLAAASCSEDL